MDVGQGHDSVDLQVENHKQDTGLTVAVTALIQQPIPDQEVGHGEPLVGICVLPINFQHLSPAVLQPVVLFLFSVKAPFSGNLITHNRKKG